MNRILSLALITYREGIRNRSVYGIVLLSLFILGLNVLVAGFFMRDIGKVTVDMNLSALSISGLLLIFFVAINLIAKDIDKKTIHLVLSKPLSRVEYVWGKYLGILSFVTVSLFILFVLSCLTVFSLKSMHAGYFSEFAWPVFFAACFFILVKLAVLSAVVVFFSTVTTSSFITLIFSVCTYVVGGTIEEVVLYLKSGFASEEVPLSDLLLQFIEFVSYLIPNLSVFDYKIEAAHGLEIELTRAAFSLGYGVSYVFVLLLLGSLIFRRREFN
ncbi:ABC transporter permease [Thermodesulfobacteriota bacterium]